MKQDIASSPNNDRCYPLLILFNKEQTTMHHFGLSSKKKSTECCITAPAVSITTNLPDSRSIREIGNLAVWTVTSAKPGNGVELLRDGREDTYWQSDGSQPHLVNIQFQKKVRLPSSTMPGLIQCSKA